MPTAKALVWQEVYSESDNFFKNTIGKTFRLPLPITMFLLTMEACMWNYSLPSYTQKASIEHLDKIVNTITAIIMSWKQTLFPPAFSFCVPELQNLHTVYSCCTSGVIFSVIFLHFFRIKCQWYTVTSGAENDWCSRMCWGNYTDFLSVLQ